MRSGITDEVFVNVASSNFDWRSIVACFRQGLDVDTEALEARA
jgi:hypothetical protein